MNLLEASDTTLGGLWHREQDSGCWETRWERGSGLTVEEGWMFCCLSAVWVDLGSAASLRTVGLYFVYLHVPQHPVQGLMWKRCSKNQVGFLPIEWMKEETGGFVLDTVIIGSDHGRITRRDWVKKEKTEQRAAREHRLSAQPFLASHGGGCRHQLGPAPPFGSCPRQLGRRVTWSTSSMV